MRLTLSLADFSGTGKNIGTLNSWFISKNTPSGLTWTTAPNSVDKGADFNAVAEIDTANYELVTMTVTMGTATQTGVGSSGGITISNSGSQYTIYISSVTANVDISVTTKNLSTGLPDSGGNNSGSTPSTPPSGGTTTDPVAGTDVTYTLVQGAHVAKDSGLYNAANRVTTSVAIKGKFKVTVNSGYCIRAVYEYTKESGDTAGKLVLDTNTSATEFTSTSADKYYGVTFTKAGDAAANNNIAPTENIVASWKYV